MKQEFINWKIRLLNINYLYISQVVADAWFSKRSFVDAMLDSGFDFISRLRVDANLKYLHTGEPTGKRERPKKHGGKVDPNNLDKDVFALVETRDGTILHTALLYSVSLGRNVRIVHLQTSNDKGKTDYKLYFCTDI